MGVERRAVLWLACAVLGACSPVAPWERERLAKPQMEAEPHPAQRSAADHVYRSREGAIGGSSATRGGGCGCY